MSIDCTSTSDIVSMLNSKLKIDMFPFALHFFACLKFSCQFCDHKSITIIVRSDCRYCWWFYSERMAKCRTEKSQPIHFEMLDDVQSTAIIIVFLFSVFFCICLAKSTNSTCAGNVAKRSNCTCHFIRLSAKI